MLRLGKLANQIVKNSESPCEIQKKMSINISNIQSCFLIPFERILFSS